MSVQVRGGVVRWEYEELGGCAIVVWEGGMDGAAPQPAKASRRAAARRAQRAVCVSELPTGHRPTAGQGRLCPQTIEVARASRLLACSSQPQSPVGRQAIAANEQQHPQSAGARLQQRARSEQPACKSPVVLPTKAANQALLSRFLFFSNQLFPTVERASRAGRPDSP
jgi:hypothetical protein